MNKKVSSFSFQDVEAMWQVGTVQDLESWILSSGWWIRLQKRRIVVGPDLQLSVRRPSRYEVTWKRPGSGLAMCFYELLWGMDEVWVCGCTSSRLFFSRM